MNLPERWLEVLPYEKETGNFFGVLTALCILVSVWIVTAHAIRIRKRR